MGGEVIGGVHREDRDGVKRRGSMGGDVLEERHNEKLESGGL
jgi:hypothetical protein